MFKHLPVAHFHDATFLTKHIEVYRRAVVTVQIRVFVRVMTGFGETVNWGIGAQSRNRTAYILLTRQAFSHMNLPSEF